MMIMLMVCITAFFLILFGFLEIPLGHKLFIGMRSVPTYKRMLFDAPFVCRYSPTNINKFRRVVKEFFNLTLNNSNVEQAQKEIDGNLNCLGTLSLSRFMVFLSFSLWL